MPALSEFLGKISKNEKAIQAAFIVAGIVLFGYVLSSITIADIYNTFSVLGTNVLLIVGILVFEVLASSLRMKTLVCKKYQVPLKSIMRIMYETTLFAVYSPGKVGELMKLDLFKKNGVRRTYCFASVVVSRSFDLLVVTMLSLGVIFSMGLDLLPIAAALAIALLGVFVVYRLGIFKTFVSNMLDSFRTLLDFKSVLIVFVLSLSIWVADASIPYIVLRTLGYNVDFFQTAATYFASLIIGLISMVPGGLGAADFSFSYGMHSLFGVAEADAVSAIVSMRIITFATFALGSLLYFKHIKESK